MPTTPRKAATEKPVEPEDAAPEPVAPEEAPEPAVEPDEPSPYPPVETEPRVLLRFTGTTLVVAPFGELTTGEVVAAPHFLEKQLSDTGLFEPYTGLPVDADSVRHP